MIVVIAVMAILASIVVPQSGMATLMRKVFITSNWNSQGIVGTKLRDIYEFWFSYLTGGKYPKVECFSYCF